jgi:hypothetical protein
MMVQNPRDTSAGALNISKFNECEVPPMKEIAIYSEIVLVEPFRSSRCKC